MKNISELDKNFKIETKLNKSDIQFLDVRKSPFVVYGVFYENGEFRRMPEEVADKVSEGVKSLHRHSAGGRVRFKTNSPYLAIKAKFDFIEKMPQESLTGSVGFDVYFENENNYFFKNYLPPYEIEDEYESVMDFPTNEWRAITLYLPSYSVLSELYIGVSENSEIKQPDHYLNDGRIVYYGSSITQGACASRPGNTYQNIISRRFNMDYINLGFSGNAKAEDAIANYISEMKMSLFVYDYDWNSPDIKHLQATHEKMFKTIRSKNPNLPIIVLSRPKCNLSAEEKCRLQIIENTYTNAVVNGDTNIHFIKGADLMSLAGDDGLVDSVHPNDLGFFSIAKVLGNKIEKVLFGNRKVKYAK